jgi:hypothetical protein
LQQADGRQRPARLTHQHRQCQREKTEGQALGGIEAGQQGKGMAVHEAETKCETRMLADPA